MREKENMKWKTVWVSKAERITSAFIYKQISTHWHIHAHTSQEKVAEETKMSSEYECGSMAKWWGPMKILRLYMYLNVLYAENIYRKLKSTH